MTQPSAWQFSIRTLLVVVAGVALFCALGSWIGALWMSLAVWTLLMAAAHVGGLVVARRRPPPDHALDGPPAEQLPRGAPLPASATRSASQLARSRPLSGWVRQSTLGGSLLGALGGLGGMWILRAHNAYGLVLGAVSAAVLGGFFAFLAASFLAIAANAFGEARNGDAPGPPPSP